MEEEITVNISADERQKLAKVAAAQGLTLEELVAAILSETAAA